MKTKTSLALLALTILQAGFCLWAQENYTITERGLDWKVLEKTTVENGTNRVHRYTELATGMNYTNASGQLVEAQEQIIILPTGGAAATKGRHQVYFPANIYNGVIEVVTPDGKHLKSRPLGISYDDGSNTVFIATLKSAQGYLTSSNQVTYRDAFTDFKADLVCTYRRGGFESDLVIRQQPPTPADYGLDESFSALQLVTEFFDTAEPVQLPAGYDENLGLQDVTLKFGKLTMTHGKAFDFNSVGANLSPLTDTTTTPVYKAWIHADGRTFLIESVPVLDLADDLNALPLQAKVETGNLKPEKKTLLAKFGFRKFPLAHEVTACTNQIQLAAADFRHEPGVVLDYNTIIANTSDFTFQAGTTYFINGAYWLYGVTTLESGAIIKCATTNQAWVNIFGTLNCQTTPGQPAIFTVKDDDSVGEIISGSTGFPQSSTNQTIGIYYNQDYYSISNSAGISIHDCQMRYLQSGIGIIDFTPNAPRINEIRNCQFHSVGTAIVLNGSPITPMQVAVRNVLIDQALQAFFIYNSQGSFLVERVGTC